MPTIDPFGTVGRPWTLLAAALILIPSAGLALDAARPTDETIRLEAYIVTGSNIPTTQTASEAGTFPVTVITRNSIDQTGYQNTAELLQKISVSNAGAVPIANNATGFTPTASSISLRGLGPDATLVLINGHRVANYPIGVGGNTAFVDLNTIPLAAVERVEVLKDGASAVYGADAVAGVVNVILRKNYAGSEAFAGYQNTTSKDSSQFTANLLSGVSGDSGSVTVGFNYQTRASIAYRDRAYSAVPASLSTNSSPINIQITQAAYAEAVGGPAGAVPPGVAAGARVFYATPGPVTADGLPTSSTNNGNVPPSQYIYSSGRRSVYNFNQDAIAFPSWTRYGMIVNGERKLFNSEKVKGYFDGSYQYNLTENQLAPVATGSFTTAGQTELVIPARTATPLPTPDGRARAAPAGAYNPFNPFNQDITGGSRFRLKEFGNRIYRDTTNSFMAGVGIRADGIAQKYNFDAGFRYSEIEFRGNDTKTSTSRFNRVLNAADPIFNPASPQYIGTTSPYNPFGYYANPIANNTRVIAFANVTLHDVDVSSLGNGYVTVNTTELFEMPAGSVGAAAGFDYRVETVKQSPDAISVAGDTIGSAPAVATNHSRKIAAAYAEVAVPLARNAPGAHALMVDLAARYESFLTNGDTVTVPKIGIRYQPFDDSFTIRGSAAKGFLEPSLYKLYAGSTASLQTLVDPRTGSTLLEVPTIQRGNPRLEPETSKSYTGGLVWSPKAGGLKGFTANVDFWRIERQGQALTNLQDTLNRFFGRDSTGSPRPGGLQTGEAVLLDSAGGVAQVVTNYLNAGEYMAQGIDFGASYVLPTEGMGRFDFTAVLSYLRNLKLASLPGAAMFDLVNTNISPDGEGNNAYLRLKGRADIDWTYHGFAAGIAANYLDHFMDYDLVGKLVRRASTVMWDVQVSYLFKDRWGAFLNDTKLTLGSNNVLNRTPPLVQYFGANAFNYAGFLYSGEDRLVYVSLTRKF